MSEDFYSFLNKMGDETGARSTQSKKIQIQPEPVIEEDLEYEDESEQEEQEEFQEEEPMNDNLDIVERSLDYSKSVIKVIRENFNQKDQKIMLETLRNTLNMMLGLQESYQQPQQVYTPAPAAPQQQVAPQLRVQDNVSAMLRGATMSEDQWNNLQDGVDYDVSYNQPPVASTLTVPPTALRTTGKVNESKDRGYNKDLNLGVRMGANGPEVDLSKISSQDVEDMKILAGMK